MRAKDQGALKPVYFTSFMPNLSTLEEQSINLNFISPFWSFQSGKYELTSVKHSSIFSLFFLSNCVPFVFIL